LILIVANRLTLSTELNLSRLLGSMKGCGELAEGADAGAGNDFVELGPNMEVIHAQ
jgi:hypothetical protein